MDKIDDLFFYSLDKTIRFHRQYTQNRLRKQGYPITVDQWLLLTAIYQDPNLPQSELCTIVFKDKASINRMIALLTQKGLLQKENNAVDKRKSSVSITKKGEQLLITIRSIVLKNRRLSLEGITKKDQETVKRVLDQVINNCTKYFDP
jgi:MarR family transcriptional regulator, transcriptional regulator for hemolysin